MKPFTDIEQSKKLAGFLPIESADMVYLGIHQGMDAKYHLSGTNTEKDVVPIHKNICTKVFPDATASDIATQLPCWSLAALLEVIRNNGRYELQMYEGGYYFEANGFMTESYFNPVDACYEMITHLNELKML